MSTVTHLLNVVYARPGFEPRRSWSWRADGLTMGNAMTGFLVRGAVPFGRVLRLATGLLAGEYFHDGQDDATRQAGSAGLIFAAALSAFPLQLWTTSNRIGHDPAPSVSV